MTTDQISAFIDDELQLDEKIHFVKRVHADYDFTDETVDLLEQEIALRNTDRMPLPPPVAIRRASSWWREWIGPVGIFGSGLVAALLLMAFMGGPPGTIDHQHVHRFVVYAPEAREAAVSGDFSNWRTVEMHAAGRQGYWEIYLPLPAGEYRYSFLLDGQRQAVDPTQPEQEQDDFGGLNSIVTIPFKIEV